MPRFLFQKMCLFEAALHRNDQERRRALRFAGVKNICKKVMKKEVDILIFL